MFELLTLFGLGAAYGLTVCSLSCLPYVAPYMMGTGEGFAKGVQSALAFVTGKLLTYSVLGGIAGYLGHTLDLTAVSGPVMGSILVAAGFTLPLMNMGCVRGSCSKAKNVSLLALGVGSSLVPCPPLAAVLLLAAQKGAIAGGAAYGAAYSLGLAVSPLVVGGGILAMISQGIRQQIGRHMKYVEGVASLILISMGLKQLIS